MQDGTNLLQHGYAWAFLTVFVGGFLTSLTPCVYPMISITVSLFGGKGDDVPRSRAMLLASAYVGGIGVMYAALGVSFALAGRAFGTFMSSPMVMVPIALLFLAMSASMFGAFELGLPAELQTRLSSVGGKGLVGAFAMGLVGGIIAAPCTGPVLASVLAFVATTRSVAVGGSLLFTYALGMGVLFFAIAAFAIALPKSGPWMEAIKSLFGVVMAAAALYFLRGVARPLAHYGSSQTVWLLVNLLVILVGIALGGIHLSFHDRFLIKLRKAIAVVAIIAGVFGVTGWFLAPKAAAACGPEHDQECKLAWVRGEAPGLAAAKSALKPVLMDFYADWCLPCKELDLKTFESPEVARELERFTLVKVDCSRDDDPVVMATKQKYGITGVKDTLPTLVLIDRTGQVQRTIDHFVSPTELLPILRAVH